MAMAIVVGGGGEVEVYRRGVGEGGEEREGGKEGHDSGDKTVMAMAGK